MRRAPALIAACAGTAALTTLLPWALAFDPEAWLVWGREALRLDLATAGGPSWKPLPVAITAPLSLLGDAAPWAWLVVARAAGLLALAGAAVLALRLTGSRVAAAAAAALVALSPWWAFNTALGNSEGMLAAAILWAVVAHLAGRRDAALLLALAAALLRPEAWPFLLLYAAWRWRGEPAARPLATGIALLVPLAWVLPELLSSSEPFRAADAALGTPSAEAAARAPIPWLEVLRDAVDLATLPVALAFAVAVALALALARGRGPGNPSRGPVSGPTTGGIGLLGLAALAWVALVSAMTAAGFAGTPRYSAPAAALAAVVAATLAARHAALALALVAATAALQLAPLDAQRSDIARRVELRDRIRAAPCSAPPYAVTTAAWFAEVPIRAAAACRR